MEKGVVGRIFFWNIIALAILTIVFHKCFGMPLTVEQLNQAAVDRTRENIMYSPQYVEIDYPNGDVPDHTGVCTDVIIRAYRAVGVDLQQLVHEDMLANFDFGKLEKKWKDSIKPSIFETMSKDTANRFGSKLENLS